MDINFVNISKKNRPHCQISAQKAILGGAMNCMNPAYDTIGGEPLI